MLKITVLKVSNTPMPRITHYGTEVPFTKTEREIWKERIKLHVKDYRQLHDQLKKMYSIIWGQVSDELCTTVKSISGFSDVENKLDAIGMLNLIQKAVSNVQSQQLLHAAVHIIKRRFYNRLQEKG